MAPRRFSLLVLYVSIAAVAICSVRAAVQIKAEAYDMMGSPPNLTGPMEQNFLLADAERYKNNLIKGPESFVYDNGHIYTGLSDGRIVDISDCGIRTVANLRPQRCLGPCSRPLGMRMGPHGKLIVADSVQGIMAVEIRTGAVEKLFSADTVINGKKCKFINDLVVARDGTILFTDSSAKWSRNEYLYIILEGESSGRLIALGPRSNKAIVVLDKLSFPNGLEFGPNEEYLLIAETSRARIRKLDLRKSQQTWLRQNWFATNLPGLPDNIRASGRGTYWVAMSTSRNDNMTASRVDQYAQQPEMRNMVAMMASMDQIESMSEKYGTIIEVDIMGNIIRSLQDPTGEQVGAVSEVLERDGFLYLGSFNSPYMSRVPVSPKFDVDRFLSKIRSTCRATNMNLVNLRRVLRRIVAIAEFRKALLNAKARQEERERNRSTTTSEPITVTANVTDATTSSSNETAATNGSTTPSTTSTTPSSALNSTSGTGLDSTQSTTVVVDDDVVVTTPASSTGSTGSTSDPDSDASASTTTVPTGSVTSPGVTASTGSASTTAASGGGGSSSPSTASPSGSSFPSTAQTATGTAGSTASSTAASGSTSAAQSTSSATAAVTSAASTTASSVQTTPP